MAFNFGGSTGTSGFSFGQSSTPVTSKPATGFNFAQSSTAGATFSFGSPKPTAPTSTFVPPASTTAKPGGFSLGTPTQPQQQSFGFTKVVSTLAAAASTNTPQLASSGFKFGSLASTATPTPSTGIAPLPSSGFNFGAAVTSAAKTSSTATGFSLNLSKPNTTSGIALNTILSTTSTAANSTTTTTLPTGLAKPLTTTSSSANTPLFGSKPLATGTTLLGKSTSAITALKPEVPTKQMSFKELEETVEKWLHNLNEQEKQFLNQARQVNIWDKQLIDNGEKIIDLYTEVERVKAEQQRLDRELDFILSQQEELEEMLSPIEEEVKQVQHGSQHTDVEREHMYRMAGSIDAQLKRMTQDLGGVIDHINNANSNTSKTTHDQSITHIAKILNAHMDSLQWLDENTNVLQKKVDEVECMLSVRKEEHERTLRYE